MPPSVVNIPKRQAEICEACHHGWIHHWREGTPPYHAATEYLNRGGNKATECGGFYSADQRWSFNTLCVCSAALRAHEVIALSNVSHVPRSTPVNPSALDQPINAYRGIGRGSSGPAPPAQGRPGQCQGPVAGPPGQSTNARRVSNYTRHRSETAADSAVAGTSSGRGARRSGNPQPFPRTAAQEPAVRGLVILCLPHSPTNNHVHHDAHGTPKDVAIPIDMWEEFYRKAETIGLLVEMMPTSENEPVWREMDTVVKGALQNASLHLQWASAAALNTFGNLGWMLIRPSYKAITHSYVMKRDSKLQAMDFTVPKLVQSSPLKNPKEGEAGQPVIIIAPKYGHLRGRIDDLGPYFAPEPPMQHLLHACFADRFLQSALPDQYNEELIAICSEHCDGYYPGADSTMDSESNRSFSPSGAGDAVAYEPVADAHARLEARVNDFDGQADDDWEQEMGMSPNLMSPNLDFTADDVPVYDSDELFPRSPSPDARARSPSVEIIAHHRSPSVEITAYSRAPSVATISPSARRPVASNDGHHQLANAHELDLWATSVKSQSHTPSPTLFSGRPARIRADTAAAAARGLFAVLVHILRKPEGQETFQVPPGVTICEHSVMVTSFTQLECDLRVGRAVGQGVHSAIYYEVAEMLRLDKECWTLKCGALIPLIKPPNTSEPPRFDSFRAYGALLALSMVTQQEGLMSTSFGVVLGLILGADGFVLTIEYLRMLNPEAAERLEVWYELAQDAPVPKCWRASNTKAQNDLFSLICDLDLDPSHIADTRTPTVHNVWTSTVTQRVLFGGQHEICKTEEFKALKEGFDYQLQVGNAHGPALLQTFRGRAVKALVGCMYMPMPVTFDTLWSHMHFQIPTDGRGNINRDATRTDYAQLLVRAVKAYLMGEGHPNDPSLPQATGLTTRQIHDERNDPHVRARLLLSAVLNKRQPPRSPSWKMTFDLSDPLIEEENNEFPLQIRACFKLLRITFGRSMEDLLRREDWSAFELWLHAHLFASLSHFNMV